MVDLSSEMAQLWNSLQAPTIGGLRVLQIVSARSGEGASAVSRELAHFVARRAGRSVWLVDLDLGGRGQCASIADESARYGVLGESVVASPDGSSFLTVQPQDKPKLGAIAPGDRYLTAHKVSDARWWTTRFRRDLVQPGQTVHILAKGDYWQALAKHTDLIIVDCPAIDRSRAALTIAPFMDQTVMVVAADQKDTAPPAHLRDAVTQAGGRVAGLFVNRVVVEPPRFLRALGL